MKFRELVWLLPLLLCCCSKNPPSPAVIPQFTFTTTYDSIINCTPNSSCLLVFDIKVLSGNIDTSAVTYSVSGLPANTSVLPAYQTVTLLLGGIFNFSIGNVPAGKDTINFTISNAISGTQNHKLILNITAPYDYATKLAGTYVNSYDYCTPVDSLYRYTSTVNTVTDTPYEIKIKNIKNLGMGFVVTGWVSTSVTIPVQTIGSYTIWGTGTYTHDDPPYDTLYQMAINDTLVNGSDTEHCTIHLQH